MRIDFSQHATDVAKQLLGMKLVRTMPDGTRMSGIIVETEAYSGIDDLASHGRAKRTPRNLIMYGPPGHIYVYLIYGVYYMLNIVCESEEQPAAILIRAMEPLDGIEEMSKRRGGRSVLELCNGPGKLAQAIDINMNLNGAELGSEISIENGVAVTSFDIGTSPRIGLSKHVYEPWFSKPWRFYIKDNIFVS